MREKFRADIALLICLFVSCPAADASLEERNTMAGPWAASRLAAFTARPKPESSKGVRPAGVQDRSHRLTRAGAPLVTASSAGAGQAGYVHYFIIQGMDGEPEIQVGIELEDQRIAWSFPRLGAVISPFIEAGVLGTGDDEFHVWHLYGIRPFPTEEDMARLRLELPGRIGPWLAARTPHCTNEGAPSDCMSCLGFVLRALFPGRGPAPALPRDWPAGTAGKYTTRDLLLYLTGMIHLPTREARLQRIARTPLPGELRDELEHLVYFMSAFDTASSTGTVRAPRQPKTGMRPPQRRKL
jgi:hypothetical protein